MQIALGHAIDALAVDENRARVGPKQSENELEHDRFPGAARAEQDLHASLRDAEADVAQDDVVVEGERDLVEHDRRRVSRRLRVLCVGCCGAITSAGLQRAMFHTRGASGRSAA